jgi:hypothetical protein
MGSAEALQPEADDHGGKATATAATRTTTTTT